MNKLIIYGLLALLMMGIVEAASISTTSNTPVSVGQQLEITAMLSSQSGIILWKLIDISAPGITYQDKQVSGGSGERNALCSQQENGKYGCNILAPSGSVIDNQITLVFSTSQTVDANDISGRWETYKQGQLDNSGTLGAISNGGGNGVSEGFALGGIGLLVIAGLAVYFLFIIKK